MIAVPENGRVAAVWCTEIRHRMGARAALEGIDLCVPVGEVFGLVGPDGAGKTTLFHILAGMLEPDEGKVLVLGQAPAEARLDIGYVSQSLSLYPDLTVEETLRYSAGVRNVPQELYGERSELYLCSLGLGDYRDRLVRELSGGMKQKLALACALISRPKILLLDEPTGGLDPIARREFWQLLACTTQQHVTAIVATPRLDEAEFCTTLAFLHDGRIHEQGNPRSLRQVEGLARLEVRCADVASAERSLSQSGIRQSARISDVHSRGDHLDVILDRDDSSLTLISTALESSGLAELETSWQELSLDDIFTLKLRSTGASQAPPLEFPQGKEAPYRHEHKPSIEIRNLRKKFKAVNAVNGISIRIEAGEIYGLLGANGAGKTTTIKMLCGLISPSSGEIVISRGTRKEHRGSHRKMLGYMSQRFTLYQDLSVIENLEFYASAYELAPPLALRRIKWALASSGLEHCQHQQTGLLPRGWQQRLAFAAATLHDPDILILDEPTSGADPLSRRQLWRLIKSFALRGSCILVTTHFLDEAEYCDRLGLIDGGKMICHGRPREIRTSAGDIVAVRTQQVSESLDCLTKRYSPWRISVLADRLHIHAIDPDLDPAEIGSLLSGAGLRPARIELVRPSLEEAFITLVRQRKPGGAT